MSFNINMKQPQKPKIAMKDNGSLTDTISMTGNALSQEQKEVSNVEFGNSVRDNLLQKEIRAIRDEVEEKINSLDLDQYIEKSETPGLIRNNGSIDTTNYTSEEYVADAINNVRSDIQDDIDILENNLKELINAEADTRAETDTALDKKIDDEIINRESAITQEVADRNIAIGVETTARENADIALGGRIDNEIIDRGNAITAEATARENADNILDGKITNEATARENADATLQQNINSKQSQLSNTQLEAVNSGINSTKVGNYDTHISNTNNPHSVTKEQVGLGNVANTGDSNTPVQDGTTKFTTGGAYTLKSDLHQEVVDEATARDNADTRIEGKIDNHIADVSNPHSVTKTQVGLGNVANTGDSATPSENGTEKFTTGGAYTLKTNLEQADSNLSGRITQEVNDRQNAINNVARTYQNIEVDINNFTESLEYEDYPYEVIIVQDNYLIDKNIKGMTLTFGLNESLSGNYASVFKVDELTGDIIIYAKEIPEDNFIIPNIVIVF